MSVEMGERCAVCGGPPAGVYRGRLTVCEPHGRELEAREAEAASLIVAITLHPADKPDERGFWHEGRHIRLLADGSGALPRRVGVFWQADGLAMFERITHRDERVHRQHVLPDGEIVWSVGETGMDERAMARVLEAAKQGDLFAAKGW